MSFLYPRVVQLSRPNATTGIGALGYQGVTPGAETILATNVQCSIQAKGGSAQKAGIPADSMSAPTWAIMIPLWALANGTVMDRDIFTDDLGIRYQVQSAYWDSLGYNCNCQRLQS